MTTPVNSQLADSQQDSQYSEALPLISEHCPSPMPRQTLEPGNELVFTQDRTGRYLSFYWQEATQYEIQSEKIVGSWLSDTFGPIAVTPFLERIRQVLDCGSPEQFSYPFRCGEHYLVFELTVSPIAMPGVIPDLALVMGKRVATNRGATEPTLTPLALPSVPTDPDRYQRLLALIAWNIRRTLDLSTIWQQTVIGLGKALNLHRCTVLSCVEGTKRVRVVAEYCEEGIEQSALGLDLDVHAHPPFYQAFSLLRPVLLSLNDTQPIGQLLSALSDPATCNICNTAQVVEMGRQSVLVVATCYQEQPNGLICLYQKNQTSHLWSDTEIELVRELADQVGTAIAHASLFAESQSLAAELQRVNDSLVIKHRELEEAHQQAEEASRLKSEFLANTSHELRTPLNGMLGFLKLIMDGMADDPEEQGEFIQEAYRSALHLLNLINDILDIAKIEAGKMQLDLNPVRLEELLSDVEDFTATQAAQKSLSFEISMPPTRDDVILLGNYQRLLQVMLNLVGNAIKFTHEGGITISAEIIKKKVMAHNKEFPGLVEIRVIDTGIGVSLDKQDKLFQSFSQIDGSRTRQYGGTGLGLAISQKLVEAMGGEVNFFSMGEGLGSTVTFTIPLYQEPLMISTQSSDSIVC
ncbi:MAG: ATP-binding protein [Leptolyngbyaceae cyanobacterium bins.59]|nr:ATP-binding protein [Leptolyngbyaceae cyanobacterium bins.59]